MGEYIKLKDVEMKFWLPSKDTLYDIAMDEMDKVDNKSETQSVYTKAAMAAVDLIYESAGEILKEIRAIPTTEVEPIKNEQWEMIRGKLRCTGCGTKIPDRDQSDKIFPVEVKRCYYCGAHMTVSPSKSIQGIDSDDNNPNEITVS